MSTPSTSAEGITSDSPTPTHEKASFNEHAAHGPTRYKHSFWDPEMAPLRKVAFKILGGGAAMSIIVMWLALPLYWGSLWLSNEFTRNLNVMVVDFDGGAIGAGVTSALMSNYQLGYYVPSGSWTIDNIQDAILEEHAWAAVVINSGATTSLQAARHSGDSAYIGTSAISAYYSQARAEVAVNSYVEPYLQAILGEITFMLSAESIEEYVGENYANTTAMGLLAKAPSTLTNCIAWKMINLRPYDQPVATAITLVGMIYMLIFAFNITMMGYAARDVLQPYMNLRSLLILRIAMPLVVYVPIALAFAMINLPFKVDFGAHYSYAGGFFLWAFTTYLGMCCLGLATEFAITIVGPQFVGFFLIAWIIVNVSVVSLPHQLQPWIYGYQPAMPFWNISRVVRTIIFNTENDVAMNLGILLAWIVVSMITVGVSTWLFRRKEVNKYNRESAAE